MNAINVRNSRYESITGGKVALGCDLDGAQYHVWLDAKTLELVEIAGWWCNRYKYVLYRNPPTGVTSQDPAYFRTQFLSATSKRGAAIVAAMRKQADANGGIIELQLRQESEKASAAVQAKHDRKVRAIRDEAEMLYKTLQQIVIECTESPSSDLVRIENIQSYARAALAKVDAS